MSNVALIVGGGTGIGYASAERLARRGVAVMLSGRREGQLKQAQKKLTAEVEGATVAYSAGDSSAEADAQRIVAETVETLGGLNFCVNCVGTYQPTDFLKMDEKAWRQTIERRKLLRRGDDSMPGWPWTASAPGQVGGWQSTIKFCGSLGATLSSSHLARRRASANRLANCSARLRGVCGAVALGRLIDGLRRSGDWARTEPTFFHRDHAGVKLQALQTIGTQPLSQRAKTPAVYGSLSLTKISDRAIAVRASRGTPARPRWRRSW